MFSSVIGILLTIAGSNNLLVAANSYTFKNSALIAVPGFSTIGIAKPYPSKITAAGVQGKVSKVAITLHGVNHNYPSNVDILLVGPTNANSILMSDAGGSYNLNNVTLTFDQTATSRLNENTQISSGTFQPTDYAYGNICDVSFPYYNYDCFPNSGITSFGLTLDVFNGLNANGDWALYIYDDSANYLGRITSGWSISITTEPTLRPSVSPSISIDPPTSKPSAAATYYSFSNSALIAIPASDTQSSTITVNAVQGAVVKVTVTLNGISHSYPDDIDIYLVGPTKENVILMSDVGGGSSLNGVTLTFDQTALMSLPDSDEITTGTYLPSDREEDSFPNSGLTLDVFNGLNANGIWTLFVVDDYAELGEGQITFGWSLFITTERTLHPSVRPSVNPSVSSNPSSKPSAKPSFSSETSPSISINPSPSPSAFHSISIDPSSKLRFSPSISINPSLNPSANPSISIYPSPKQSAIPSVILDPSSNPSTNPSISISPSSEPTANPSISINPSYKESAIPSVITDPSSNPRTNPSISINPSSKPSTSPISSINPSSKSSVNPSIIIKPSSKSSARPSASINLSTAPSKNQPTKNPTKETSPTTNTPSSKSPSTSNPTTKSPSTSNPTTKKPTTKNPTTKKPTTKNPTTTKPTTKKPTTKKPTTKKPTTKKPTTKKPTTKKPTTKKPTTKKPTTRSPTTASARNP